MIELLLKLKKNEMLKSLNVKNKFTEINITIEREKFDKIHQFCNLAKFKKVEIEIKANKKHI